MITLWGSVSCCKTDSLGDGISAVDRLPWWCWHGPTMEGKTNDRKWAGNGGRATSLNTGERACVCVCLMKSQLLVCLSDSFLAADSYAAAEQPRYICLNLRRSHTKNKSKAATTTTKKEPSVFFLILHCCHGNNWALRCSKLSAKKDTSAGRWTKTETEMKAGHANTKCLNVLLMLQSVNYSLIHHTTLIITRGSFLWQIWQHTLKCS